MLNYDNEGGVNKIKYTDETYYLSKEEDASITNELDRPLANRSITMLAKFHG